MDAWDIVNTYFKQKGISKLVEHQIESFEDFIRNKIPLIVSSTQPIVVWHDQDPVSKKYRYEFRLSFENVSYVKPRIQESTGRVKTMFPHSGGRQRNYTYAAQMFCDVRFTTRAYKGDRLVEFDEAVKIFEGISLGKIPVMLGSSLCVLKDYPLSSAELGECSHDPFGYFIIHGSERTVLCQEKVADNRIMVFNAKKSTAKYSHSVEIKSLHESFTTPPKKFEIRVSTKFNGYGYPLICCFPRFREDIPLMVVFRAIGIESDADVWSLVQTPGAGAGASLIASFKEAGELNIYSRSDAINYLSHHLQYATTLDDKLSYVKGLLETELLPHVRFGGDTSSKETLETRKCVIIARMVSRLLAVVEGIVPVDDRDAYPNKRVVTAGANLTHLFRQLFQKVCKDIRSKFVHEVNNDLWKRGEPHPLEVLNINNLYKILKISTIEGKLKQALATGNFTVQGLGISTVSNATKIGVSQVLNRLSYNATVSHLRRIQTPVEKSGKLLAPRKLHGTSWGYVCPVETPEGHSVGIVKAMAMMSSVTQHSPSSIIIKLLSASAAPAAPAIMTWINTLDDLKTANKLAATTVCVNGVIVGYTTNPKNIYDILKNAKKTFVIHPHSGVSWNIPANTIEVESDGGRFVRPLIRKDSIGKIHITSETNWTDLIHDSIEYIDPLESEHIRIGMFAHADVSTATASHYEIHPALMLGHMASSIPLSDHNQSPRNTYQSAMGKQAISIFARNYASRLDKNGYILCSPERPFVETRIMNILKAHEMPSGNNLIVAIGTYGGYNQEDSVILNRASVDRGMFRTLYYTIYKDEEHRNIVSGKEEKFIKPKRDITRGYKNSSYGALTDHGVPRLHSEINENDVVIGKVTNLKNDTTGYLFRDVSTCHKNAEKCRVDGVWQDKNSDGYPFVKVRVVSERIPEVGDKVSSRHGQKGTCGIMLNEEDMPYNSAGLRPDLIMNPHAIPSRMTIAQLMENMFGKICTQRGTLGDGTPYSHLPLKTLKEHLLDLGMHPYGNEILYNGETGEMMESEIFMGPVFYQRLKHMVKDKCHCLTPDHFVYCMVRGFIPIAEVTVDDKIFQFNPESDKLEIVNPLEVMSFDYEGDIYEISNDKIKIKVTANHRMWIRKYRGLKYELVEMKDITGQFYCKYGIDTYGKAEKLVRVKDIKKVPYTGKVYCLRVPSEIFIAHSEKRIHTGVLTGNSRAKGPIVSLTRQPCEGRSRDGGLRVGEMERDCMLSHGVSLFTKERLMDVSDPFTTGFCKSCGQLAVVNEEQNIYHCGNCKGKNEFEMKTIPYAVKLWTQELEAMHIVPRMVFT